MNECAINNRNMNSLEVFIRIVVRYLFSIVLICAVFFPVFLILIIRKFLSGRVVFVVENILGKEAKPFKAFYFNTDIYALRIVPLFLYVLGGKLKIVGLSIKKIGYESKDSDDYLFADKPGIISLLYVRQSTRIVHKSPFQIEQEYLSKRSLKYDTLLFMRALLAVFYTGSDLPVNEKVNILGVEFNNITMSMAIDLIKNTIISKKERFICFINADCLNKIFTDRQYYDILRKADNVFPDGIGIHIGCKILKQQMQENVNGTDMMPWLCEMCCELGCGMYLLGAKPGVAEKAAQLLKAKYSGLKISGCHDGYFDKAQSDEVIEEINSSGAAVLLVAFGVPIQEKWLFENKHKIKANVMMGVGGLFDFYSGNIKRAPVWLREMGGEWIYRLIQEPKRMWKRYIIGNPVFLYRVFVWKKKRSLEK